jgi:diacylglycerol kinase
MDKVTFQPKRSWWSKFRNAFRGMALGVSGQNSFAVHLPVAVAVVICGFVFRVSLAEWGLLILCITIVLAAEMFNSALESMAKAIDQAHNPRLGDALDMGSAAVLTTVFGAVTVGSVVFLYRLGVWFGFLA